MSADTVRVTCAASAASCKCGREVGHGGPHECEDVVMCNGAWIGDYDTRTDFKIVRFPGVGS